MRSIVRNVLPTLAIGLAGIAAVLFDFRFQLRNGGQLLNGDRYDGFIAIAILEHWHNVVRGLSSWATTRFFFPTPNTLGYNDGYLLHGLVYSALRAAGSDPFLAGELVNAVLRVAGFAAFYAMGRRVLRWPRGWSLFGALLFTLSNNLFLHAHHTQLFAVCFVPVMVLLLHEALAAFRHVQRTRFTLWALAAAAFFAAWLMTAFYMAWYFAFFTLVTATIAACMAGRAGLRDVVRRARALALPLAVVAAGAALLLAPFVWLYLPKARETGMHAYAVALAFAPNLLDVINVGEGNVVWGWLVRAVDAALGAGGFSATERATGFPLGMVIAFIAACAWLVHGYRKGVVPMPVIALAAATVVVWALALRIGDVSGWWLVYHLVPGAKAARAVTRIQIFLAVPIVVVVVSMLSRLRVRHPAALAAVCLVLLAENANVLPPLGIARPAEVARLAAIGAPPVGCSFFFASSARPGALYGPDVDGRYSHNADAMLVAELTGLPTINGVASFAPPWWNLSFPAAPDYRARVAEHVARFGLAAPCELDLARARWVRQP